MIGGRESFHLFCSPQNGIKPVHFKVHVNAMFAQYVFIYIYKYLAVIVADCLFFNYFGKSECSNAIP